MARKKRTTQQKEVQDYRHDTATRKNNPPAGIAAHGKIKETPKQAYAYTPHLPPNLRSDPNGDADKLPELLQIAQQRALTAEEAKTLANALQHHTPWLEWAGKHEAKSFAVDPVALHIHERVSAKAILKVAERQNVQRELFADPQQDYSKAVDFYEHDVDWANRLILGDSLTVMSSLAHRENLAGKVQMIYMDPPYGIKFASNFQPTVFQRDVKDRAQDLTREPEQIRAYRDTWTLGIHSYLAYLRDRLIVAKDLLTDSGSVFVQIGEENVHLVRNLMDEVFKPDNFVSQISVFKTTTQRNLLDNNLFYLLWYARDIEYLKYRQLFIDKRCDEWARETKGGSWGVTIDLKDRPLTPKEKANTNLLLADAKVYQLSGLTSAGAGSDRPPFTFEGTTHYTDSKSHWKTSVEGLQRLNLANRLESRGIKPWFKKYHEDFPVKRLTNAWVDTSGKANERFYVVQTQDRVIERCILMSTDPGDIILDPTCGGGTTAYVAEQWGRRWITMDTSRVAIALARQRLLTNSYEYYKFKDDSKGVAGGFENKIVPHITLKSIAQNTALDPIFAKYEPMLKEKLNTLNLALAAVTQDTRTKLLAKLTEKQARDGKRAVTDADMRRWQLPKDVWQEWEVPFDTDPDWPKALQKALTDYRKTWRAKMDEVNACIDASSEGEELVDQPATDKKRIRVSGPFTVEAVQPAEESLYTETFTENYPPPLIMC